MTKMILKKVYISRGGGVKANLEKVYISDFFMMASLLTLFNTCAFVQAPVGFI